MPALFSSFVWHLAGMRFVQVDRLERGFCYSYGMLCDSSDTNDVFFFFFFGLQDSCLFLSSKKAFRTPDEPEIRRNNGLVCMQ